MGKLRTVFMATPSFALPVLKGLERALAAGNGELVAVYTAPDRRVGRGQKWMASPIKKYALVQGYPVRTPLRLSSADEIEYFKVLRADLVVVMGYGQLLISPYLFGPTHGAINIHPSLLPKYRGASPVAAAILAGDTRTGTTLMKMDEGLDTGPILASKEMPLRGTERTMELTVALCEMGAKLLEDNLSLYVSGKLKARPQSSIQESSLKRFTKDDGWLNWHSSATEIERRVRALNPWPGTATLWGGSRLSILSASTGASVEGPPGSVISMDGSLAVVTSQGTLKLGEVCLTGKKAMLATDFVRGHQSFLGAVLPS